MNRRDFLKKTGGMFVLLECSDLQVTPSKKLNTSRAIQSRKVYLTSLSINDGLFSTEKAVVLTTYDGTKTSGFISNEKIKNGKLEVKVVDEKQGLCLVKLPGRMLEAPGDKGYITVKKDDLKYAA